MSEPKPSLPAAYDNSRKEGAATAAIEMFSSYVSGAYYSAFSMGASIR